MSLFACSTLPQEVNKYNTRMIQCHSGQREKTVPNDVITNIRSQIIFASHISKSKDATTYQENTVLQNEYIHDDTYSDYNPPQHHQRDPFLPVTK